MRKTSGGHRLYRCCPWGRFSSPGSSFAWLAKDQREWWTVRDMHQMGHLRWYWWFDDMNDVWEAWKAASSSHGQREKHLQLKTIWGIDKRAVFALDLTTAPFGSEPSNPRIWRRRIIIQLMEYVYDAPSFGPDGRALSHTICARSFAAICV